MFVNRNIVYVCAGAVYLVILAAFVWVATTTSDSDAVAMAGMAASSALMLLTLIFAVVIFKGSPSEQYKEKYIDGKDDDESDD